MKRVSNPTKFLCLALFLATAAFAPAIAHSASEASLRAGVVNFKTCIEKSKVGIQSRESFDAMKKQMESIFAEKTSALKELAGKLKDSDYLDSLTPDAETEMRRKANALEREASQIQNEFIQTLQQANGEIIQKITETIKKASENVAGTMNLQVILSDESSFYYDKKLDISDAIIKEMDLLFEKELKEAKEKPATPAS